MKKAKILLITFILLMASSISVFAKDYPQKIYDAIDVFYPVGSYYETSDGDFNPSKVWGGSWELETEGRVHMSAGSTYTNNSTGGTADEIIPAHTHYCSGQSGGTGTVSADHSHWMGYREVGHVSGSTYQRLFAYTGANLYGGLSGITANHTHGFTLPATNTGNPIYSNSSDTSGSATNANMQPYINVYKWKRVS